MFHQPFTPRLEGNRWPVFLDSFTAQQVAMLVQLEASQWLSAERLVEHQFSQLAPLVTQAVTNTRFYRDRFSSAGIRPGRPFTPAQWRRVPVLRREDLQSSFEEIRAKALPKGHGEPQGKQTSGSTGEPVRVLTTALTRIIWFALTLRAQLWNRREFQGKFCVIRPGSGSVNPKPVRSPNWGIPHAMLFSTGPSLSMDCRVDTWEILNWLQRENPDYVLSYPSVIEALARISLDRGIRLPALKDVTTISEVLSPEVRALVLEAWGVRIIDMYSCEEAGYIALQCPAHEHLHVQSESVLVEVVDDGGEPCKPGETGRLLITSLHNFATPLIRYQLNDFAEVGEPCPCGRGLPVLTKITGRRRNLITLPDGRRYWPTLHAAAWSGLAPIRQIQLHQDRVDHFTATLVMDGELDAGQRDELVKVLRKQLGYDFDFSFQYQSKKIQFKNGKFESITTAITSD